MKYNEKYLKNFDRLDAKENIIEESKNYNIVFINEAHHKPQHRAFTHSLLEGLYNEGFRYLALEALTASNKNDEALQEGVVALNSGLYLRDPTFANMVKEALRLGYTVFSYDAHTGNRDKDAADYLYKKWNAIDNKKMLIHCGFDHINKDPNNEPKWLAAYLQELTNEEVLSINQTQFNKNVKSFINQPIEHYMDSIDIPTVFYSFYIPTLENAFDLYVFHPAMKLEDQRPVWKNLVGYEPYWYDRQVKESSSLIFAYSMPDPDLKNDVPVDLVEAEKVDKVKLLMPKGKYMVLEITEDGQYFRTSAEIK